MGRDRKRRGSGQREGWRAAGTLRNLPPKRAPRISSVVRRKEESVAPLPRLPEDRVPEHRGPARECDRGGWCFGTEPLPLHPSPPSSLIPPPPSLRLSLIEPLSSAALGTRAVSHSLDTVNTPVNKQIVWLRACAWGRQRGVSGVRTHNGACVRTRTHGIPGHSCTPINENTARGLLPTTVCEE